MGIYLDKVREGIKAWADSPESDTSRAMAGFDKLYQLFMENDEFTKAVIDGAETIDKNFLGYVTEDALSQYIQEIDSLAVTYGGSYEPLVKAFMNNPDQLTDALAARDLNIIDVAFMNYADPLDISGTYASLNMQNDPDNQTQQLQQNDVAATFTPSSFNTPN